MLPKRISKPPQAYFTPLLNIKKRKKKKTPKVVKPLLEGPRCHYQVIPNPTKYALNSTVYQIYGVKVTILKQLNFYRIYV